MPAGGRPCANLNSMNVFRLRRLFRSVAAVVLATVLGGVVHIPTALDACVPAPEHHDESKHAFTPLVVEQTHGHCAICHWQRVQRPSFTQVAIQGPAQLSCAELASAVDAPPPCTISSQLPPRAPPAPTA